MILYLEKHAALFSYSRSVENIVCILLREGSWYWYALPFFSNSTRTAWNQNILTKQCLKHYFLWTPSKNIVHFYFLRDLDTGGYALSFLNLTRTAIWMERICGAPSFICNHSVWKYRAFLLGENIDIGRHYFSFWICSDPGRNSDPSSNWCSLGSTYVNTNLSIDPFDAIFALTGNSVFQNEAWDGWPIKCR